MASVVDETALLGTTARLAAGCSYNFVQAFSDSLKIQRVFGGLYPLEGFLILEVGYCIGSGDEHKNKKVYDLPLGQIIGNATFPSSADQCIIALFQSQMMLLKDEILGLKMRPTWGTEIMTEVENQVWEDIERLVIYVLAGAARSTRLIPERIKGAAEVENKERGFNDEEDTKTPAVNSPISNYSELSFTSCDRLDVEVFLSYEDEEGNAYHEEDITESEFPDRSADYRFLPSSLFVIEESSYAETDWSDEELK